ncbi:MAG: periplasmic heavy metal sensor [Phycisphaerae bacterium]|jgi:Spy/CpxP family protein refolding chaperone
MSRFIVLVCFLVAFAAGLAVGLQSWHVTEPASRPDERRKGWLVEELGLTPEQQEQMNRIWSETAWGGRGEREERRRALARQRDEAIAALVRPEDRPQYDEVMRHYSEQKAAIDREAHEAFENAVEQTKGILNPQQREKYETILKNRPRGPGGRDWDRGSRGGRGRGNRGTERGRQGDDRATTRPVASHSE